MYDELYDKCLNCGFDKVLTALIKYIKDGNKENVLDQNRIRL